MRDSGNDKSGQVVDGELLSANTPPRKRPRLRLGSILECRRELVKLYTEARQGRLPTQEATRLTYLIQAIVTTIKDSELEEQITKLEKIQDEELRAKNRTY